MDAELKEFLLGMQAQTQQQLEASEQRVMARMGEQEAHFDPKLDALEQRLLEFIREAIAASETRFTTKLDALEQRLLEFIREELAASEMRSNEHTETVETRLLTQFWKWARVADIKGRQQDGTIVAIEARLNIVEDRLNNLDMGLAS